MVLKVVRVAVVALAAVCAAQPSLAQNAPAVAETRIDVDGDGTLDVIRIDDPPAVSIVVSGPAGSATTPVWKPFAAAVGTPLAGTVTVGSGKRFNMQTVIVATVEFAGGARRGPVSGRSARTGQAMVLAVESNPGGPIKVDKLWEGAIGATGSDGEYAVRVAAAPFGLIRYQERADVRRCDGQPAYLFPQGFDFKRRQFRSIASPLGMPANAPVITASPTATFQGPGAGQGASSGAPTVTPAVAFRSQSASAQAYADHAGLLTPPRELDDGDPATAWREHTGGYGRGLFITLSSPMTAPEIVAVRFTPGDAATVASFRDGNRLRRLGVLVEDKHAFWIDIPTDPIRSRTPRAPLYAALPDGVRGRCVTVLVADVYPGRAARTRRGGETAISDLAVITDLDLSQGGPEAVLIQQVIAGGSAGENAARMLTGRGSSAAAAIVQVLASGGHKPDAHALDFAAALRLRRVLARIGDPVGAGQLAAGLAVADISKGDARAFRVALARMGDAAIPALAGLLQDEQAASDSRIASAEVLASMPGQGARDALVGACGLGGRDVRKAVSMGLGQRATAELDQLVAAAEAAARREARSCEPDLWRAIGVLARRASSTAQARITPRLVARLRAGPMRGAAHDYERTYRLLDALGGLPTDAAIAGVTDALAQIADHDAHSRALRRVAAASLERNGHSGARTALVALVGDGDPGVRQAAVAGLGLRTDADSTSDRAIMDRLAGDTWPGIRQVAAGALARRCGQEETVRAALDAAVDGDDHITVQREALTALVECRAPGIGPRLLALAGDRKRAEELRLRALSLVPSLADPALVAPLLRLFDKLRGAAWSDEKSVRLASAAAVALGRTGSEQVVATLMKAAREPSFPEIQAAAVTGLGEMCPPQARPLFVSLLGSDQRAVLVAARAAHNRCKR